MKGSKGPDRGTEVVGGDSLRDGKRVKRSKGVGGKRRDGGLGGVGVIANEGQAYRGTMIPYSLQKIHSWMCA